MSEELTPTQALEKVRYAKVYIGKNGTDAYTLFKNTKLYSIIETALKDYEKLEKCYKNELKNTSYYNNLALKYKIALEIINSKNVDTLRIKITQNVTQYNKRKMWGCKNLVKEEYELLKEILK